MNSSYFLAHCPNLCGHIARYIDGQLKVSQPAISLGAALSFCAALYSGKIISPDGIEPNMYACTVAYSGAGKSQAQKALQKIINECALAGLLIGKPASDSGLLRALAEAPQRLLIWDEFGIALSEMSKSQNSYRALILSTIMDLFSQAGGVYVGKEYSERQRVDINAPYLSVFAASTPNRFFSSLNEDFIEDGFLSRWLIFFVDQNAVTQETEEPRSEKSENGAVPSEILAGIEQILSWERGKGGNLSHLSNFQKKTLITKNQVLFRSTQRRFDKLLSEAKTEIERVFYSRAFEHFSKLCIAISNAGELQSTAYPLALLEFILGGEISQCKTFLGRTERQKIKDRFLMLIRPGEKLSHSQLTKRAYRLNLTRLERNNLIDDFLEAGLWERSFDENDQSRKKSAFYKTLMDSIT